MGFKVKLKGQPPTEIYKDLVSDFDSPDQYKQVLHYQKRLKECGPFDIDFFLDSGPSYLGDLHPCHYPNYEYERAAVDKCVLHAIAFAKKEKRMDLVDQKVVNAKHQCDCGTMYYITFEAKDKRSGRSGRRQLYDAKVLYGIGEYQDRDDIHVRLIRVKKSRKKGADE